MASRSLSGSPRSLQLSADLLQARAGGLSRYVDGLARALRSHAQTRVLGMGIEGDPQSIAGLDATFLQRLSATRRRVRAEMAQTDLIATHFALYALPVIDVLRANPHVLHFHGPWADESAAEGGGRASVLAKRFIERRVYATADRAIVLSQSFATLLTRTYGVPADRVTVIPGGIDIPSTGLIDRATARSQLGWPTDRPIVLCVRRLARRMGLDVLIDAIASIRKNHPDLLVLLAGKGSIARELQEQIDRADLRHHVRLLGFVPDEQLPLAYSAADFTVVPSQSLEGFGLITLESMVHGTPVLVTPVGGLPETVTNLDAGLVLADKTTAAIANGISRAFDAPSQLPSREVCRAYVASTFSWPTIAARVMDVYREAIRSG